MVLLGNEEAVHDEVRRDDDGRDEQVEHGLQRRRVEVVGQTARSAVALMAMVT